MQSFDSQILADLRSELRVRMIFVLLYSHVLGDGLLEGLALLLNADFHLAPQLTVDFKVLNLYLAVPVILGVDQLDWHSLLQDRLRVQALSRDGVRNAFVQGAVVYPGALVLQRVDLRSRLLHRVRFRSIDKRWREVHRSCRTRIV